jgi:lipopolysaccharide transport system permease protein
VAARVETPLRNEGSTPHAPAITISADRRTFASFRELWEYRELLYFLMWRDVKVRYKQTVIGAAWAVIQPLVTMVIFTIIFGRLARIPSAGVPYPVFAYAGLLPWHLFAGGLQRSIQSVVSSAHLISKVYFPRLIVPLAATFSSTIDFAIAFIVLVVMAVVYGLMPTWRVIALPGFVGLALLSALGVGLWLSALNVRYRDVGHAIPFLIQVWMYASPVVYPVSLVPERWRLVYSLNPMVGVVEGFRWALLGKPVPDLQTIVMSAGVAFLLLTGGLAYFRRMERTFADVI